MRTINAIRTNSLYKRTEKYNYTQCFRLLIHVALYQSGYGFYVLDEIGKKEKPNGKYHHSAFS